MFEFTTDGTAKEMTINGQPHVLFPLSERREKEKVREAMTTLKLGSSYTVSVKQFTRKRSLKANDLLWVYCEKIAQKIRSTKTDVYRSAIHDVGVFDIVPIRNDALEAWIRNWESGGLGWICEIQRDSKIEGHTNVVCYHGSSSYDTKSMKRLLDWILDEAKELDIPTPEEEEIQRIAEQWENANGKR